MLRGVPALLGSFIITLSIAFLVPSHEASAIIQAEEEPVLDIGPEVVIVNGSLSAPGATGDAIPLRSAVASLQIPRPEAFSAERLLSQHAAGLLGQPSCSR